MKIGFIGLGKMGAGMARNLLLAGHAAAVYNRTRDKAEALEADGARIASSPADACDGAEAVFTMLADDPATEEVVFGPNGLADGLKNGAIHVASGTISTRLVRRLTEEHGRRGQGYIAAPVFGRPEVAASGKLIVVVSGAAEMIKRCQPLFDAIGRQTFVAGMEPWKANLVKLCGNFTILSMIETFGEVSAALRKSNVDPTVFLDAMNELYGSPVVRTYGQLVVSEKYEPAGFALKLGLKDTRLLLQAAEECETPMPVASLIRDNLLSAMAHGQSELDWASVAKVAGRNTGLSD
jgi:3-hydroxyisobutyrate dehydrogenase-like beta-hydroxyacid dehydrogenase